MIAYLLIVPKYCGNSVEGKRDINITHHCPMYFFSYLELTWTWDAAYHHFYHLSSLTLYNSKLIQRKLSGNPSLSFFNVSKEVKQIFH